MKKEGIYSNPNAIADKMQKLPMFLEQFHLYGPKFPPPTPPYGSIFFRASPADAEMFGQKLKRTHFNIPVCCFSATYANTISYPKLGHGKSDYLIWYIEFPLFWHSNLSNYTSDLTPGAYVASVPLGNMKWKFCTFLDMFWSKWMLPQNSRSTLYSVPFNLNLKLFQILCVGEIHGAKWLALSSTQLYYKCNIQLIFPLKLMNCSSLFDYDVLEMLRAQQHCFCLPRTTAVVLRVERLWKCFILHSKLHFSQWSLF